MESLSLEEEENIIKDIRILFRLKKEQNYTAVKDIINLFRQEEKTKVIKNRILRDAKNLSKNEKDENYYKPVRVNNLWSNNYIEYESNGNKIKRYKLKNLNKVSPHLKDVIINNLKKSSTWKIQLTITNNYISSIDNDKERVIHSK